MKILIDTNPCENCDFCPSVCNEDIEFCMVYGNYNEREENKTKMLMQKDFIDGIDT